MQFSMFSCGVAHIMGKKTLDVGEAATRKQYLGVKHQLYNFIQDERNKLHSGLMAL